MAWDGRNGFCLGLAQDPNNSHSLAEGEEVWCHAVRVMTAAMTLKPEYLTHADNLYDILNGNICTSVPFIFSKVDYDTIVEQESIGG